MAKNDYIIYYIDGFQSPEFVDFIPYLGAIAPIMKNGFEKTLVVGVIPSGELT